MEKSPSDAPDRPRFSPVRVIKAVVLGPAVVIGLPYVALCG